MERYPGGAKRKAEYRVRGKLVGVRFFEKTGEPSMEWGIRNGKQHGRMYTWWPPGHLLPVETYKNGASHGTALQWDENGRLLGSYTMAKGTGIDLWWQDWGEEVFLHEVHYMKDGAPHGWEWWINDDQRTVWDETHWHEGELHGIQRRWNIQGRLRRGFPKYWLHNKQVTRRIYVKACSNDPALPLFRNADNLPARIFPAEIRKHLNLRASRRRTKRDNK